MNVLVRGGYVFLGSYVCEYYELREGIKKNL